MKYLRPAVIPKSDRAYHHRYKPGGASTLSTDKKTSVEIERMWRLISGGYRGPVWLDPIRKSLLTDGEKKRAKSLALLCFSIEVKTREWLLDAYQSRLSIYSTYKDVLNK